MIHIGTRQGGWVILAAGLAAVSLLPMSAYGVEEFRFTETRTFEVGAAPYVELESVAGNVKYTSVPGTTATVEIVTVIRAESEKEADEIRDLVEVKVAGKEGVLTAETDRPDDFWRVLKRRFGDDRSIAISFIVTGPKGAEGSLSSVSGDASLKDVTGAFEVSSVSGDVTAEMVGDHLEATAVSGSCFLKKIGGRARANTVSGEIEAHDCGRDLQVESVSGNILVTGVAEGVDASSVSGEIELSEVSGDLSASTTSGDITLSHDKGSLDISTISGEITGRTHTTDGRISVNSTSGDISLYTDASRIGNIELSTYSGNIRIDASLGENSLQRVRGSGELSLNLGRGDLDLSVTSQSGDIVIGKL